MDKTSVQKLARVLRVLVIITFVCNIITLFFVPALAGLMAENRWDGQALQRILEGGPYQSFFLQFIVYGWHPVVWMLALTGEDFYWPVLTLFLLFCGICTAVILWQGKRVLDTILKGNPFTLSNAVSLKRAAVCCFVIAGAALLRLIWGFATYRSILPLLTYNALFVPIFLMAGLLCMVMSALFRQAAEIKAENDLTI
ncbi:MAG: DUF2975 domain-containing protein [Oscillospiraceae bacterium]|nr:DUF2975 domain-containing protein [Oscillospiraceae bacterium]